MYHNVRPLHGIIWKPKLYPVICEKRFGLSTFWFVDVLISYPKNYAVYGYFVLCWVDLLLSSKYKICPCPHGILNCCSEIFTELIMYSLILGYIRYKDHEGSAPSWGTNLPVKVRFHLRGAVAYRWRLPPAFVRFQYGGFAAGPSRILVINMYLQLLSIHDGAVGVTDLVWQSNQSISSFNVWFHNYRIRYVHKSVVCKLHWIVIAE